MFILTKNSIYENVNLLLAQQLVTYVDLHGIKYKQQLQKTTCAIVCDKQIRLISLCSNSVVVNSFNHNVIKYRFLVDFDHNPGSIQLIIKIQCIRAQWWFCDACFGYFVFWLRVADSRRNQNTHRPPNELIARTFNLT